MVQYNNIAEVERNEMIQKDIETRLQPSANWVKAMSPRVPPPRETPPTTKFKVLAQKWHRWKPVTKEL